MASNRLEVDAESVASRNALQLLGSSVTTREATMSGLMRPWFPRPKLRRTTSAALDANREPAHQLTARLWVATFICARPPEDCYCEGVG